MKRAITARIASIDILVMLINVEKPSQVDMSVIVLAFKSEHARE